MMSKNEVMQYCAVALAGIGLCVALSACDTTSRAKQERRTAVAETAYNRSQQQRVRIPVQPTELSQDYGYPPYTIRQSFKWGPYENEWRLTIVDTAGEYAGFLVKKPVQVPPVVEGLYLYFELWPVGAAEHLALGLLDNPDRPVAERDAVFVEPYRIATRPGQAAFAFAIPLRDFESQARMYDVESDSWKLAPRTIDWSNVRGVHIIRTKPGGEIPRRIVLRHFQIATDTWIQEMKPHVP